MMRAVKKEDAQQICNIYNHYVKNTTITFEEESVSQIEMENRIIEIISYSLPWFVYEEEGKVIGYVFASKWKGRCAYRFTVESSIYLHPDAIGLGIGNKLYTALIDNLLSKKIHIVIGGIALPNNASIKMHERFGFKKVAHFSEVGFKFNNWIDVGYWELRLNKP